MKSIVKFVVGISFLSAISAIAAPIGITSVNIQSNIQFADYDPGGPSTSDSRSISQTALGTFNDSDGLYGMNAHADTRIQGTILDSGVNFFVSASGGASGGGNSNSGFGHDSSLVLNFTPSVTQQYDITFTLSAHSTSLYFDLDQIETVKASLSQGSTVLSSGAVYANFVSPYDYFGVGTQYRDKYDEETFHFTGVLSTGVSYQFNGSISGSGNGNNFNIGGSGGSGEITVVINAVPEADTLTLLGFGSLIPAVAVCRNRLKRSSR